MKVPLEILFFIFILVFGNGTIYCCICPFSPLRSTFREAKAIFIGKLPQNNFSSETKIRGAKNGTVLEVEKSWKGVKGNYFSVTTKFEDYGMCTLFLKKFEKGRKYLIFAEGENYEVRNYCSYSEEIYSPSNHPDWYKERQQKSLEKLDKFGNFWFRFAKRIRLL